MDKESLERMIAAARTAGAEGIFVLRDAYFARLEFVVDTSGDLEPSVAGINFAQPHELIFVARFALGDGGQAGIEFRD